jgi:hypothetical protein
VVGKGEPWGRPATGAPQVEVRGDDTDLAAAITAERGRRVLFSPGPGSDLARAVGVAAAPAGEVELPVDALVVRRDPGASEVVAVNMVVLGVAPDRLGARHRRRPCRVEVDGRLAFEGRATTVVIANGQFLRGLDVVPRGHPGDGRCEVQVYAMRPGGRRAMRRRLPAGVHLPHPDIRQHTARTVSAAFRTPQALEIDGRTYPPATGISVEVAPEALLLLV